MQFNNSPLKRSSKKIASLAAHLLCGVSISVSLAGSAYAADDSLKILTLNTWGDRFRANPSLVDDFFINGNFDVMTFQEFNGNYHSYLPGMLQNAGQGTYGSTKIGDVGVISRVAGTYGSYSTPGLSTQGRHISYTTTDAQGSRPQTTIGTVHLDWQDTSTGRINEAKGINQWAASQTGPIILTGDFNGGDVSERGLHSVSQQELLLRTYVRNANNSFYLSLLREYAKDQDALDAYIADWSGKTQAEINASTIPSDLFEPEMYPVDGNLPQTMNVLKKQFMVLQTEAEREKFVPHELNDGSATWPSAGEDATNVWASWHRVKIDHFLASRPFGKWWTIEDDENDPYSGVIKDVYVTNPDGTKTPLSDHEPVAHTLRWVGPVLENYDEVVDGTAITKTRVIWSENASKFDEDGKEFFLTRNNMRTDVYLGQISDENGLPILTGLTDEEKKTLLDCKSTDARFQQAIKDYCIDDHTFIGELVVTDNGTVIVEEDAALGTDKADLVLDGGRLRIAGESMHRLDRHVVLGEGGGAIEIAEANNAVLIDKEISGQGGLSKQGAGALFLDKTHSYTGNTTVEEGLLVVNGSIAASAMTSVVDGGILAGSGAVGNLTIATGGVLAPGSSIGTLNVAGDLLFQAGGALQVEVDPEGTASDRVAVTGKATLEGGSVVHVGANGNYRPASTYTILTAGGGIDGRFDAVTSDFAFLDPSLLYRVNAIDLRLERNATEFVAMAATGNQNASAAGIESVGAGNALYDAIVMMPDDASAIRAGFDSISGEVHASIKAGLIRTNEYARDVANERIRGAFGASGSSAFTAPLAYGPDANSIAAAPGGTTGMWASAYGSWADFSATGNTAKFTSSTGGILAGADGEIAGWQLGFLAGYGRTNFEAGDRASSGDSNAFTLGVYGGSQWGNIALRGGLLHSWHDVSTSRSVAFGGFSDHLQADYWAGSTQLFGEAGYAMNLGTMQIEPFANLAHVHLSTGAYQEAGGAAALSASRQSIDTTFTTLGIRGEAEVGSAGVPFKVIGMVGWRHAFGDVNPTTTQAFAGGDSFTISGAPIARNAALVETGLKMSISPSSSLGLSYQGQFSSGATEHSVKSGLTVRF